ncbi:hypothetical protein ACFVH6_08385 [Spirillospora sp. NPDC127200]
MPGTPASTNGDGDRPGKATRTTVAAFGLVAAAGGAVHGIGLVRQGPTTPDGMVGPTWTTPAAQALEGISAFTLLPTRRASGLATVLASAAIAVCSTRFVGHRRSGPALIGLSILLLGAGGGFGPPPIAAIAGIGATQLHRGAHPHPRRARTLLRRAWPWALGCWLAGFLSVMPGALLLYRLRGKRNLPLTRALFAFTGLAQILALTAAHARDHRPASRPAQPAARS